MTQPGLYSDPYDPDQKGDADQHRERVRGAFDSWHKSQGDQVSKEDEARMLGLRDAVENKDTERAKQHLTDTQEHSGWLYEELMKHPEISAIMRELSIMGF